VVSNRLAFLPNYLGPILAIAIHISSSVILLSQIIFGKELTSYEVPRHSVFSNLLALHLSSVEILFCGEGGIDVKISPHINTRSSFVDLHTEQVLKSDTDWTQRNPNCTRCACCCETGAAPAEFFLAVEIPRS
jgi:hypothetical protein